MKLNPETGIPPRKNQVKDEPKRFYISAKRSVKLALEQEAFSRGTDAWTLAGLVVESWISAGCPDYGFSTQSPVSQNPPSSPSPSPLADDQGGKA